MALRFVKEQIADNAIVEAKIKDEAVTNAKLAGSIANEKLSNSTVSFGGVSLALGASDATPAFDLADATNLPTSSLTGTITNAQLAGSVQASKLLIDSANFEEIPAGDNAGKLALKSGSVTNAQLDGSIANDKLANSSVTIAGESLSLGGSLAAGTLAGALTLSAIGAPSGAVAMNSQKITGMADPTAAQDAATKAYVDSHSQGLDVKESVVAATTANHASLANLANGNSIDGVTLATGDRILVHEQTNKVENGIYVVAASGAPARSDDFKAGDNESGAFTFVQDGTKYKGHGFVCIMGKSEVVGTNNCPWSMFSESTDIVAGAGLVQAGNAFDVDTDESSIEISGEGKVRVKESGITNAMLGGSIANAKLANSTISGIALGSSLGALTDGNGIADFSYTGSGAASIAIELDGSTLSVGSSGLKIATDGVDFGQLAIRYGYDEIASTSSTGSINLSNRISVANFRSAGAVMVMLNGQVLRDRTGASASSYDEYVLSDNGSVTTITLGGNVPDGSHLAVRYIH